MSNFNSKSFLDEEAERDERVFQRFAKSVAGDIKRALVFEKTRGGKRLPPFMRKRWLMSPEDFLEKAFVRVSYANLLRRYRYIRIDALAECLAILVNETDNVEAATKIRKRLVELGRAQTSSKDKHLEKENK